MGGPEVAHSSARMTSVQLRAQSFGGLVGGIQRSREMRDHDLLAHAPFLDSKVLNVDVARAGGRLVLVDHGNSSHVVHMENSRARLHVA